jgi:hypothetical protein
MKVILRELLLLLWLLHETQKLSLLAASYLCVVEGRSLAVLFNGSPQSHGLAGGGHCVCNKHDIGVFHDTYY